MRCEICGSDMKPLFTSYYCPNDCDKEDTEVTAIAKIPTKENSINIPKSRQPKKSTTPLIEIIKQIMYYEKLKEVSNQMFCNTFCYDLTSFTSEQVTPASERQNVEQQAEKENL